MADPALWHCPHILLFPGAGVFGQSGIFVMEDMKYPTPPVDTKPGTSEGDPAFSPVNETDAAKTFPGNTGQLR